MRLAIVFLAVVLSSQAGFLKIASFPVRHPVHSVKAAAHTSAVVARGVARPLWHFVF